MNLCCICTLKKKMKKWWNCTKRWWWSWTSQRKLNAKWATVRVCILSIFLFFRSPFFPSPSSSSSSSLSSFFRFVCLKIVLVVIWYVCRLVCFVVHIHVPWTIHPIVSLRCMYTTRQIIWHTHTHTHRYPWQWTFQSSPRLAWSTSTRKQSSVIDVASS